MALVSGAPCRTMHTAKREIAKIASRSKNTAATPESTNIARAREGFALIEAPKPTIRVRTIRAMRSTAPSTPTVITTARIRSCIRCAAAACAWAIIASSSGWSSLQPAADHSFTSLALLSSSGKMHEDVRSLYSTSKCDATSLASFSFTSGTIGLTAHRNGHEAAPVRWAVERAPSVCSTRIQQPRQRRCSHESTTGRKSRSRQMGQV
mmetsp:Transcript_3972/g.7698  ORF Transcript_3972/g.7698 Transcript_3972/m.7698 type:complete len:208 (-) Transcript_3972:150-773(-)